MAMKYLGAYPEYVEPLREEVQRVIDEAGWTKDAMVKLRKMGSFVREVLRVDPGGASKRLCDNANPCSLIVHSYQQTSTGRL